MKEKTFEELMHNKFDALEEYGGFKLSTKQQNAILELMQNVREATKEEILKLTDDNLFKKEPKWRLIANIEKLPTDRIKTDK